MLRRWAVVVAVLALVATGCPSDDEDGACPAVSVPGGASDATSVPGDFDGDGSVDDLISYLDGGTWHLQVDLAAGGGDDLEVTPEGPAGVAAMGGVDLDDDGTDEAWARVGVGASVAIVGLFDFDDCELVAVSNEIKGEVARFTVGGTVNNMSGVRCGAGPGLGESSATSTDGESFMIASVSYELAGATLEFVLDDGFEANINEPDFPEFSFDCGGLSLP